MIRNKILIFSLCISTLLLACGSENAKDKSTPILKGKVTGLTATELYLIDLLQPKAGPIDTAKIQSDGTFIFDYQPKMKGFYRITLAENFGLVLPLVEGETAEINGDLNSPQNIEVKGSKDAVRIKKLNDFLQTNYQQSQALEQEFQQFVNSPNRDSVIAVFRARYAKIEQEKVTMLKKMIDDAPKSFTNLAIIEQMPPEETAYYKKVDEALASEYGESPYYTNFHAKMAEISRFAVGSEVPEINLPNPEGKMIPLSSLRGQVVLIDFWASWCKPCRQENPNVVAAYNQFKDKGFTVYGVSLDRAKDAWVRAIAQDGLNWPQVSDLKFWQSEAARAYGVSSIPFALLIDKDGKVLGKNLRGAALAQKLAEVLN